MLPGYNKEKPFDWVDAPDDEVPPYEPLVGVPIRGIPVKKVGNMSLTVSASYSTLDCSPWENLTEWFAAHPGELVGNSYRKESIFGTDINIGFVKIFMDTLKSTGYVSKDGHPADDQPLYNKFVLGTKWDTITSCNLSTTFIDVNMFCVKATAESETTCTAQRARHNPSVSIGTNDTVLSRDYGFAASIIPANIPWLIQPSYNTRQAWPLENYLADPAAGVQRFPLSDDIDYESIPMRIFQARLALVIDTYMRLALNTTVAVGNDGLGIDLASRRNQFGDEIFANTTGTWTEWREPVYTISAAWITLYFVATVALTMCACVTVVLRARTKAPDFLGSVTALTRDTPFVTGIPPGGSALNGSEMARLLKSKRVRIQDVNPEGDVGKVAFSSDSEIAMRRLKWDRRYD